MKASKFQQAIYTEVETTDRNILVNAVAGSGKTYTITQIIKKEPITTPMLYLAFNKSIQLEMAEKIKRPRLDIRTLHSLGYKSISQFFGKQLKIQDNKIWMISELCNRRWKLKKNKWIKTTMQVKKMVDLYRMTACGSTDDLKVTLDQQDILYDDDLLQYTEDIIQQMRRYNKNPDVIDFVDMIYLPITIENCRIATGAKLVFADECQDFNLSQHLFFDKLVTQNNARWVSVGDPHQCQPTGTKVLMRDLSEKNIEDLVVGDKVISYDKRKCQFIGYGKSGSVKPMRVLQTKKSLRVDKIYTVVLNTGHKSSYTSNHKCYLRFSKKRMKGKYFIYLMRKGESYRMGISPCTTKCKVIGIAGRARSETADDLWILDVFDSREEAYLFEQIWSYKYKIPQTIFKNRNCGVDNQKRIDKFWSHFKNNRADAQFLLNSCNRDIRYPIWSRSKNNQGGVGNSWKLSSEGMFKTQACNIIPDIMQMCIFDTGNIDSKKRIRRTMVDISTCHISEKLSSFYSLDIENNHNYVADGILTSNSIYGFVGAHSKSFELFKDRSNVVEYPLSECYRCTGAIVEHANEIWDIMTAFSGNEYGEKPSKKDFIYAEEDDMILCRNSKPLIKAFFQLIGMDKKAHIKGKEIHKGLHKMISKFEGKSIGQAIESLNRQLGYKEKELRDFGVRNLENNESYCELRDKIDILTFILEKNSTVSAALKNLEEIFDESKGGIILSTMHKSKGLEANRVFILNRELIPNKFATTPQMKEQEWNLYYVARTRAKKNLYYAFI